MQNNRQTKRQSVSVPATIECGPTRVGGVIVDVSATGARVRLSSGAFMATQCTLITALFGEPVQSRVVWRRGAEIGLRFKTILNVKQEMGALRTRSAGVAATSGFGRRVPVV